MTPHLGRWPYRDPMQVRRLLKAHSDVAIALALGIAMATELAARRDDLIALPVAVLGCLPLSLRRSMPVVSFVLTWLGTLLILQVVPNFDEVSVTFIVGYFLSLSSLGRYADGREQPISVLLVLAGVVFFVANDGDPFAVGDVMFALFFVGGPWTAGLALRLRQARVTELHQENLRLQTEQEELTRRAVAAERATIARELHDVVSHAISVTVLQARGARRQLGTDEQSVRRALDAIEQTNTSALSDMRRLLAVLRDTDSSDQAGDRHAPAPSLDQLSALLAQVRGSGVPVEFEVVGEAVAVPPGVDLSAYRIVQEALTNVIKHAGEARAKVRLDYSPDALTVSVVDDGHAQSNGTGTTGQGLIGIQERVSVVGGEVSAGPGLNGGFEIIARLPYSIELS